MWYPWKILNKKKYFLCFLNAFVLNVCIYGFPMVLSYFVEGEFTLSRFSALIIAVVILKIVEIILNVLWNIPVNIYLNNFIKKLQVNYFNRISKMKIFHLNQVHNGFLKKQVDIVTDQTSNLLSMAMSTINGFIISVSFFLFTVYRQDPKMLVVCILFIVLIIFLNVLIGKKYVPIQKKYNETYSNYNSTYVDFLQNIKTLKRLDAETFAASTIEEKYTKVLKPQKRLYCWHSLRTSGINVLVYALYILILLNLFFQMKAGREVLSYLIFYSTIFTGLSQELRDISALFVYYHKFKAASIQVEELIGQDDLLPLVPHWSKITIKDLSFSYEKEGKEVIAIPNFELVKGDKISIMGESGQGKTTFLNLFSKILEGEEGHYFIDDKIQAGVPSIAYVSQETDLLDLSIKENICLGKEVDNNYLWKIIEDAGLKEWILSLAEGLDTVVGERGLKLSTGQKQRLNLIRGILLDKDIYILDEPTSNLDLVSESKIIEMIHTYLAEKTCLMVTHRPNLTVLCNRHYHFVDHRMKEAI